MSLRSQIDSRFNVVRWMGDEALVSCPHPDHDDHNPSASINVSKGVWVCYSCGRSGTIEKLLGERVSDPAVEDLLTELSTTLAGFDSPDHGYPESWLDQFDAAGVHPYWINRGLSERVCREFRLGYDPETGCATYPLRGPSGAVLGVVRRATDGLTLPKYRYPDHAPIGKTLFGYYKVRGGVRDIVVTEGALDALAFWDVGIPAVAQMGSSLSEDQERLLQRLNLTTMTIAYDQDEAGQKSLEKLLRRPSLRFAIIRVARWDRDDGKDPLELAPQRRKQAYEDAEIVG